MSRTSAWLLGVLGVIALHSGRPVPGTAAMDLQVTDDKILFGHHGEFIPRFASLVSHSLVVKSGETVTLPPDSTWDAIEVQAGGVLKCSRDYDTRVAAIHIQILPGGRQECGTAESPLSRKVEWILRDAPIDTTRDPFQWGNGWVNLGHVERVGTPKTSAAEIAEDVPAGATTLTLSAPPAGWAAGDEIVVPDTRQMGAVGSVEFAPRRDRAMQIAAIEGARVTLTAPLGFERRAIRAPDGKVVVRPVAINLTRNIRVRSENPAGTRGHFAHVGSQASFDIRYNEYVSLGRTKNAPLDNTAADRSHIGTNPAGRYGGDHIHHLGDGSDSRLIGNSYRGDHRTKWTGIVAHQSHAVLIEHNVCVDSAGACFVTEDGNESGNIFRHNVAAYVSGSGPATNQAERDMGRNCSGCEGAAFWFRGVHQTIEFNQAWASAIGINLIRQVDTAPTMRVPEELNVPVSFKGNITAANRKTGLEYWGLPRFPAIDHVAAHNGIQQIGVNGPPADNGYFINVAALGGPINHQGKDVYVSVGIAGNTGYVDTMEIDGGLIAGNRIGLPSGMAIEFGIVKDVVLQNELNVDLARRANLIRLERVEHRPIAGRPHQYIRMAVNDDIWDPGEPTGDHPFYGWGKQRGSQVELIDHNRSGQDYLLYELGQRRSAAAMPAIGPGINAIGLPPFRGMTLGQTWDQFGMVYRGEVIAPDEEAPLDGLIHGLARKSLARPLGPPRTILTIPNMLEGATPHVEGDRLYLFFLLTGSDEGATRETVYSINGGDAQVTGWQRSPRMAPDVLQAVVEISSLKPGLNVVTAWRKDTSGKEIPGSRMTFSFCRPGDQRDPVSGSGK